MTRDDILALPASELAEVSARMMGRPVCREIFTGYVDTPGSTRTAHPAMTYFRPYFDHNDAREVADWVCDQWASLTPPTYPGHSAPYKCSDPKDAIDFTLDETRGTQNNHWAWTPEQLTRAALLAFVDAGGEI